MSLQLNGFLQFVTLFAATITSAFMIGIAVGIMYCTRDLERELKGER